MTVVLSQDLEPYRQALSGFRKELDGRDLRVDYHVVDLDGADAIEAGSLVPPGAPAPDLVLAIGARAARAVLTLDQRAPVGFAAVADPGSLDGGRAAGRAAFGVSLDFPFALQFQTLRAIAPRVRKVGTIHGPDNRQEIQRAATAAREAGLALVAVEVGSPKEIPAAVEGLLGRVDALWGLPDSLVFSQETASYIILQTLRRRLPFMGFSQNFVKAGSLISLYSDLEDVGQQAGLLARDLLQGRRQATGEVVAPRKALLAINLRVADVIGLSVPAEVRRRAHSIFE